MTTTRDASLTLMGVLLVGCSGGADRDRLCLPGQHWANPDGRGDRCIEDVSSCDESFDCASQGGCCAAACADPWGSGVYECVQSCEQPSCTAGSCGPGFVCQPGADECSAFCVPDDVECPDGSVPADPGGTGQFVCIRSDSQCFVPPDCAADIVADPCCTTSCLDGGDGLYACTPICAAASDGGAEDPGYAQPWECTTDGDCEANYGPGWTCDVQQCGAINTCVAPQVECAGAADCAIVQDTSVCCSCPFVVPRSQIGGGNCWQEVPSGGAADRPEPGGGAAPELACNVECDPVPCDCAAPPQGVDCDAGLCVAVP